MVFSSQLISTVSGIPVVWNFINHRPRNIFLKRLWMRSRHSFRSVLNDVTRLSKILHVKIVFYSKCFQDGKRSLVNSVTSICICNVICNVDSRTGVPRIVQQKSPLCLYICLVFLIYTLHVTSKGTEETGVDMLGWVGSPISFNTQRIHRKVSEKYIYSFVFISKNNGVVKCLFIVDMLRRHRTKKSEL